MHLLPLILALAGCAAADFDFIRDDDAGVLPPGEGDDEGPTLGPQGNFGVWYWEAPPVSGPGVQAVAGFNASFVDVIDPGEPGQGGVDIAGPPALDTCALTTWDAADLATTGGVPGQSLEIDAGILTFSSPDWTVDLEAWDHNGPSQYYFELNPDFDVVFETLYELHASGGAFPAFDSVAELLIPDAIHLENPLPEDIFDLPSGDFTFEWSGGGLDEIWIELHTNDALDFDNAHVSCRADNDGSFTVPGAMTAAFPAGEAVVLALQQPRNEVLYVGSTRINASSSAASQASGVVD